jgi:quercetin dioxygenase-like cupin family protein
MRTVALGTALVSFLGLAGAGNAAVLNRNAIFEGVIPLASNQPATPAANVSVQSWELMGPQGTLHELPLTGFYVAHLLSGAAATTIDGQTTQQPPGAYWTVKPGATMQVKVESEMVVIETIAVTK